jgi:protein arginine N-methyltransferase 7
MIVYGLYYANFSTGTGLLAMMAVRAGADRVTAIEAFEPMARVARKVITDNHYADRIRLIDERSTDLCAGEANSTYSH